MTLKALAGLKEAFRSILDDLGCWNIEQALYSAWKAVMSLWATILNERAHFARIRVRNDIDDVYIAVLCQKNLLAEYAFFIHTMHPVSGNRNEIYQKQFSGSVSC